MPTFDLEAPDGQVYEIEAPDEASALKAVEHAFGGQQSQAPLDDAASHIEAERPKSMEDVPDILDPNHRLYGQRHGGSIVTGMVDAIGRAVTLPREVYDGEVDLNTDEGLGRVLEAATIMTPTAPGPLTTQGALGIPRAEQKSWLPGSAVSPKPGNAVAEAATRQGVEVPVAVASDSMLVQRGAQAARNIPGAGNPIVRATDRAVTQLGTKLDDVSGGMGGASVEGAGTAASKGITGWIKDKSGKTVEKAYQAVDEAVDDTILVPLARTKAVADEIAKINADSALPPGSAVSVVKEAVSRDGMNYSSIKNLRTKVGEMMDEGILPSDMSRKDLKRIYGALTEDLKESVKVAGGEKGLGLFNRANSLNSVVAKRREKLAEIVGSKGDASPARVYDRLVAAAGSKSRADTALLLKARKAIGSDWDEFASGVIGRLGRDADGAFTPDRFVTDYGKLSEVGKSVLFPNREVRQALDDVATISRRMKDVAKQFGNPSGTAQGVMGGAAMTGLYADPATTISVLVGANVFSRIVSRPTVARAMRNYAKAAEQASKYKTPSALAAMERAKVKMLEAAERAAAVYANDNASRAVASGQ